VKADVYIPLSTSILAADQNLFTATAPGPNGTCQAIGEHDHREGEQFALHSLITWRS
jgi:hypothetical protein